MWDMPFEESMLERRNVIIFCPEKDLADELFELFEDRGICWCGGESISNTMWERERENTCYRVTHEGTLKRGDIYCYEDGYTNYIRCQFYGVKLADEISDSEFETIIRGG